ncbi:MAG: ATP-binding response regulator [Microcoleaceae cyanobacterium]
MDKFFGELVPGNTILLKQGVTGMLSFNPSEFRILVVDDLSQDLQLIGKILDEEGYQTTFSPNGLEALEQINTAQPDLIFLDLTLETMNSLEVYEELNSHPNFCQIPIIYLTLNNERNSLVKVKKKKCRFDYVTKPYHAEKILIRVENKLRIKKLKQQLEEKEQQLKNERERHLMRESFLQEAKERAEASHEAKSAFLANMSHEFRTPLNAILGFTKLMKPSPNLTEEQKQDLEVIYRSGEHLLSLINDILDLSKIESGKSVLNPVDFNLTQMLWELEELFRLKSHQKNLQLDWILSEEIPQWVKGDRVKLRQVLTNLISNAIKFTQEGRVQLQVRSEVVKEELLLSFAVSDTGVGMTPQDIDRIFEPFVQGNAGITSSEGTGLGLAISQKYVQLLGGDISVTSEVGRGTTFQFQIALTPLTDTHEDTTTSTG